MRIVFCLILAVSGCRNATQNTEKVSGSERLSTAAALAQNALDGWATARLATAKGGSWVAAISKEAQQTPKLALLSLSGKKSKRIKGITKALFAPFSPDTWPKTAEWSVALESVPADPTLMLLIVSGSTGNDLEQKRDALAVLRTVDGQLVWRGLGAWETLEMGRCTTGQTVDVTHDDGASWLVHRGYAEWTEQTGETSQSPDYARLKRDCRAPANRRTRLDTQRAGNKP